MDDVIKRRVTGAIVLVVICLVVVFFVISRSGSRLPGDMHSQSVRVYKVLPSGKAVPVSEAHDSSGANANANTPPPAPANPADGLTHQSASASHSSAKTFQVPPVVGNKQGDESSQPHGQASKPQSAPARHEMSATTNTTHASKSSSQKTQPTTTASRHASDAGKKRVNPSHAQPSSAKTSAAAQSEKSSTQHAGWFVQVGSFASKDNATRLVKRLQPEYNAFYNEIPVNGKKYYRVRVGPYKSKRDARGAADNLHAEGLGSALRHVK